MTSGRASSKAYCASRVRKSRARPPRTPCPPHWRTGSPPALSTPRTTSLPTPASPASPPSYGAAGPRGTRRAAGTCASATPSPTPPGSTRRCSATWRTGSPRSGSAWTARQASPSRDWPGRWTGCTWISRRSPSTPRPTWTARRANCCGCTRNGVSPGTRRAARWAPTRSATRRGRASRRTSPRPCAGPSGATRSTRSCGPSPWTRCPITRRAARPGRSWGSRWRRAPPTCGR